MFIRSLGVWTTSNSIEERPLTAGGCRRGQRRGRVGRVSGMMSVNEIFRVTGDRQYLAGNLGWIGVDHYLRMA